MRSSSKSTCKWYCYGLNQEGKVRFLQIFKELKTFLETWILRLLNTDKGITALQMDMKITGLPVSIISDTIKKARPARLHILEKMQRQ